MAEKSNPHTHTAKVMPGGFVDAAKQGRYVNADFNQLKNAMTMVLQNGGRCDIGEMKVYEVKNVLRVDFKIREDK